MFFSYFYPPFLGVGAAVIDNYLYVVGGHSGSSYLNTVQKYDPISDTWLDSAGMIYCRCNFGLTALWQMWTHGKSEVMNLVPRGRMPNYLKLRSCIASFLTWSGMKTQSFVGYFELTGSFGCSWLHSESIIKKKKKEKKRSRHLNRVLLPPNTGIK